MKNIRRIIKEEINDFDWINQVPEGTQMPFNNGDYKHRESEIMEDVLDGVTFRGWYLEMDFHSGALMWDKSGSDFIIYATPHWDVLENKVPVEVSDRDSRDIIVTDIFDIPERFNTEEEVREWYSSVYPNKVFQILLDNNLEV